MEPDGVASNAWRFVGSCLDGEHFELLPGCNVWELTWTSVRRDPPAKPTGDPFRDMSAEFEIATVRDPIYGNTHEFRVYEAIVNDRTMRFAASEFSNNVWGFYLPRDDA